MTLSSAANTIVICALGGGLGAVLALIPRLTPRALDEAIQDRSTTEGRLRGARIRDEDLSLLMRDPAARGWRIATLAMGSLVIVLVLTLWLSPVDLVWWQLLVGIFAGGLMVSAVYQRAQRKHVELELPRYLDPLSDSRVKEPEPVKADPAVAENS